MSSSHEEEEVTVEQTLKGGMCVFRGVKWTVCFLNILDKSSGLRMREWERRYILLLLFTSCLLYFIHTLVYSFDKLVSTNAAVVPFLILPFLFPVFLTPCPPDDCSQQAFILQSLFFWKNWTAVAEKKEASRDCLSHSEALSRRQEPRFYLEQNKPTSSKVERTLKCQKGRNTASGALSECLVIFFIIFAVFVTSGIFCIK